MRPTVDPSPLRLLTRHSRPATLGLDQIVEGRPLMQLETFVEYFLGAHNLWDASVPASGSLFTPHVSLTCLYSNQRFSVYLVMMKAGAEFAPHTLKNTTRFEVYLSGDYFPTLDTLQLVWPDQCVPQLCWQGFKVLATQQLGVKAGPRGCSFLSFRRGPAELFDAPVPDAVASPAGSATVAEGSNFGPGNYSSEDRASGIDPKGTGSNPVSSPPNPPPARASSPVAGGTSSHREPHAIDAPELSRVEAQTTAPSRLAVGSLSPTDRPLRTAPDSAGPSSTGSSTHRLNPGSDPGPVGDLISAGQNHSAARDALDRDRVPSLNSSDRL